MQKFFKQYGWIVICVLFASILPLITEWISRNDLYAAVLWAQTHLLLYLFVILVELILIFVVYFVTSSFFAGLIVPTVVTIIMSIVNYFKILYNDNPFSMWDLTLLSEFGDVSGSVEYTITSSIIISLLIFALAIGGIVFAVRKNYIDIPKISIRKRLAGAAGLSIIFICIFQFCLFNSSVNALLGFDFNLWSTKEFYASNGFIPSFTYGIKDFLEVSVSDPTPQGTEITEAQDAFFSEEHKPEVRPNIILILSESESDISKFEGFTYSQDPMAYTKQLASTDAAHLADMLTPVYGGGTSNAEYDVLTSNSALDLPYGVIAYKQRIKQPMFSVAQLLKNYGYDTTSIHPFMRKFWDRDTVHPNLGFDEYLASESFTDPQYVGSYISDNDFADKIIETYETKRTSGNPQFIFGISMENHMDWDSTKLNEENPIKVVDQGPLSDDEKIQVEVYGQGVYDANKSLEKLVNYFSNSDQPTIIVQFGDHLPAFSSVYTALGYDKTMTGVEHNLLYYTTPVLYWSNYGAIDLDDKNYIASNYVSPYLIKESGLPMPPYYDFLFEMEETVGMPLKGMYIDQNGNEVLLSEAGEEYRATYQYLQGYWMFQDKTFMTKTEAIPPITKENE